MLQYWHVLFFLIMYTTDFSFSRFSVSFVGLGLTNAWGDSMCSVSLSRAMLTFFIIDHKNNLYVHIPIPVTNNKISFSELPNNKQDDFVINFTVFMFV